MVCGSLGRAVLLAAIVASAGCIVVPDPVRPPSPTASGSPGATALSFDCRAAFKTFDRNGDGFIDSKEEDLGLRDVDSTKATSPEKLRLASARDSDGDKKLSPAEYCDTSSPPPSTPRPPRRKTTAVLDCKAAFKRFDLNRDGKVDLEEGKKALAGVFGSTTQPPPEKLRLAQAEDVDDDDAIDQAEYCAEPGKATSKPTAKPTRAPADACGAAFAGFDANGDGKLQVPEIEAALEGVYAARTAPPPEKIRLMFALDGDGDGALSRREYCAAPEEPPALPPAAPAPAQDMLVLDCETAFAGFDANGDGVLDLEELEARITAIAKAKAAPSDAELQLMRAADQNGDGLMDAFEYCAADDVVAVPSPARTAVPTPEPGEPAEPEPAEPEPVVTPAATADCRDAFDKFDANGDGLVDYNEIYDATSAYYGRKTPPPQDKLALLLAEDADGNDAIDRLEYCEGFASAGADPATAGTL